MLGRRRRKERDPDEDDRDKTLEPDKPYSSALSKSATSVYLGGGSGSGTSATGASTTTKKERTPFRLHRNHSDRTTTNKYRSRPELSLLQGTASAAGSSRGTGAYDWDASSNASRIPSRYNNDHYDGGARSRNANNNAASNYGYYDGRDRDKENAYKSKYDPSTIYADLDNADGGASSSYNARDRERRRFMKYKRTGTTAIGNDRRYTTNFRDYDHDLLYGPSVSARAAAAAAVEATASRYGQRKNHGYQRSKTQMFFDTESDGTASLAATSTTRHRPIDLNNNSLLDVGSALLDDDEPKTEQQKEREARRKEIQGLIMKYAQTDDIYNRATEHDATTASAAAATTSTANKSSNNHNNSRDIHNIGGAASKYTHDLLSVNSAQHHQQRSMLPLSKTQSMSVMPSTSAYSSVSALRSRIPKTLSTFVSNINMMNNITYNNHILVIIIRLLLLLLPLLRYKQYIIIIILIC